MLNCDMDGTISAAKTTDEARMREIVEFTAKTFATSRPVPFGALIVHSKTGERLMRAVNAVAKENDPSSHAELRAVRLACKKIKQASLSGYTLYSTCEPCAMCMANALWARLDRVVYGATVADASRHCLQIHLSAKSVAARSDMPCIVDGPVLRKECYGLFTHPKMLEAFAQWSIVSRRKLGFVSRVVSELEEVSGEQSPSSLAASLAGLLAEPSRVIDNPQVVERLSRDFYWYSPVLKKLLVGKSGDVVVQPISAEEVQTVLAYCYRHNIAVTARGSGTGNYGQAVPLAGGTVLDLSRMDQIEEISEDGVARCQPGTRLGVLEAEARKIGWELRCYPSTVVKASVGGFLGGGSGGIGSISHGGLRDFGTVRAIEVVTMEAEPRVLKYEGEKVHDILHAWGTNGIITRIWLALTPSVEWAQAAVAFASFDAAFHFGEEVANGEEWTKRLVTVFEWPIPSFFGPIKQVVREGKALVFLMIASRQLGTLYERAVAAGGEVSFAGEHPSLKTVPLLSDYTWNHTTLWAIRADSGYTYLQCGFDPERVREQFAALKQRYGEDILFHIEFMKNGSGVVVPGAIPIVRFKTEESLNEMIDFCRENGVGVANPHVNHVEGGGRYRSDNVQLLAKQTLDPKGLLNPGKMATFVPATVTEG